MLNQVLHLQLVLLLAVSMAIAKEQEQVVLLAGARVQGIVVGFLREQVEQEQDSFLKHGQIQK